MEEAVFIVFHNGDRLKAIIDKVSEGFRAKQYNQCPKLSHERQAALGKARQNIADMETVMGQTREHRLKVLNAAASNIKNWLKQVSTLLSFHSSPFFRSASTSRSTTR